MRAVITVWLVIQLCSCMSFEFIEVDEVKQDSLFLSNIAASNLLAEYDADLDGLINDREEMYGTSPSNPDTDGYERK